MAEILNEVEEGIVFSEESLLQLINHCKTSSKSGYVLPAASADTLGGVKVGSGINVEEDGTISASGGGGMTLLKKGTTSTVYFRFGDVIGDHKKFLIYIKSSAIKHDPCYSAYLDLDFFNDYYSDALASGSIYMSVGSGFYKSNDNMATLGIEYSRWTSAGDTITFVDLGGGNIGIDAYYVYALD